MQPGEALDVAAQVAVTLAGFAGIVVVFRPQSLHQWSAIDRLRLRLLLANSALPLVSSLFGILLLTADPAPAATWRWCSLFSIATWTPFVIWASKAQRIVPRQEFYATMSPLIYYSLALVGVVSMALQVINVCAWNRFWPFYGGIFFGLVAGTAQFVRLILLPGRHSQP